MGKLVNGHPIYPHGLALLVGCKAFLPLFSSVQAYSMSTTINTNYRNTFAVASMTTIDTDYAFAMATLEGFTDKKAGFKNTMSS